MPKGGDLHHHYSGAVYTETLLEYAINKDFCLNIATLEVQPDKQNEAGWKPFSLLQKEGSLRFYQQKVMEKWSIKDFNGISYPSDKQFFETFGKFEATLNGTFEQGLLELKNQAIN